MSSVGSRRLPIHLLLVTTGFFDDGPGRVLQRMLAQADPRRVRVDLLALSRQGVLRGETTARVAELGGRCQVVEGTWSALPRLAWELGNEFSQDPPDVIHAHLLRPDYLARLLAWRMGVPLLITDHGTHALGEGGALPALVLPLFHGRFLPRYAQFATVSRKAARELVHLGAPQNRVQVVPNEIDATRVVAKNEMSTQAARARLHLPLDADLVLLSAGNFLPVKATDIAIRAVQAVLEYRLAANPHLFLAGEGPLDKSLRLLVDDLGLNRHVHFLGKRADLPELLPAADVFVHPSRSESFGLAVGEAVATGLPVVLRSGAIPEEVTPAGATILRVAGDEARSWARAAIEAKQLGAKSVTVGSDGQLFSRYFKIYERLRAKKAKRR